MRPIKMEIESTHQAKTTRNAHVSNMKMASPMRSQVITPAMTDPHLHMAIIPNNTIMTMALVGDLSVAEAVVTQEAEGIMAVVVVVVAGVVVVARALQTHTTNRWTTLLVRLRAGILVEIKLEAIPWTTKASIQYFKFLSDTAAVTSFLPSFLH
jgi:hypothetical protein